MKKIWIDLETTGINTADNYITEIACIYDNGGDENIFHAYIRYQQYPFDYDNVAKLTKLTPAFLAERGNDSKYVYEKFKEFLSDKVNKFDKDDKIMLLGYNVKFDEDFLRNFFIINFDKYYGSFFYNARVDVMSTFCEACIEGVYNVPERFNLSSVYKTVMCKDMENAHSAIDDIRATKDLYEKIKGDRLAKEKL